MPTDLRWIQNAYTGRLGTKQFIPLAIIIVVVQIIGVFFVINPMAPMFGTLGMIFSLALVLAYSFATMHVFVRRLHDIGYSGWFVMVMFIPYIGQLLGILLLICLAFKKGNAHSSKYGRPASTNRTLTEAFFNR